MGSVPNEVIFGAQKWAERREGWADCIRTTRQLVGKTKKGTEICSVRRGREIADSLRDLVADAVAI